ncbi:polyprenol monophosphomannose synthase [Patescibacteria group bacterium]|nr:polyprenol monophosphomannose synthase [Patescibacteria group bacterium]
MNTYIIVPTYNEKDNIEILVRRIADLSIAGLHICVVDDNSPDGTGVIVDKLINQFPPVMAIHRKEKLGLGSAYIAGFEMALKKGADFVFEMDADLSHNPDDIPRFLEEAEKGNDVVIGSRRIPEGGVENWSMLRNWMSKGAMWFSRTMLGLKTRDVTSGYRCYARRVIESIDWEKIKGNGYSFQEETIYLCEKMGFKVKEIPIMFKDRTYGHSKLSKMEIVNFFITIVKLRFKK